MGDTFTDQIPKKAMAPLLSPAAAAASTAEFSINVKNVKQKTLDVIRADTKKQPRKHKPKMAPLMAKALRTMKKK